MMLFCESENGLAVDFDSGIFLSYSFVLYKGEGSITEGTWQAAQHHVNIDTL